MKVYCQFFKESTGYVPGSIPPRFDDKLIKPIEMIGTDGVFILDGRNNLDNQIIDCKERMGKLRNVHPDITGFEIRKATNFRDKGRTIYSTVKQYL